MRIVDLRSLHRAVVSRPHLEHPVGLERRRLGASYLARRGPVRGVLDRQPAVFQLARRSPEACKRSACANGSDDSDAYLPVCQLDRPQAFDGSEPCGLSRPPYGDLDDMRKCWVGRAIERSSCLSCEAGVHDARRRCKTAVRRSPGDPAAGALSVKLLGHAKRRCERA